MENTYRYDLINHLIRTRNYTTYLEVGTRDPADNFDRVVCHSKECIDPSPLSERITYKMTSDEAFRLIHREGKRYDIIFIDGLHLKEQVDRDIENGLRALREGGVLVLHDCNPPTIYHAHLTFDEAWDHPITQRAWNGTVYQSIIDLRLRRDDLRVVVVDTDWGCGVVWRASGSPTLTTPLYRDPAQPEEAIFTYRYLHRHRRELLNLISVAEFYALFSGNGVGTGTDSKT